MIRLKGINKVYKNGFKALENISLSVEKGEFIYLVGPSGAGKSTLLKILSRVTAPSTGVIKSRGRIASLLEVGTGFSSRIDRAGKYLPQWGYSWDDQS